MDHLPKTQVPSSFVEALPAQFINWRDDKIPCDPHGNTIDPHNPANWTDYATAKASPYPVGWVLTERDDYFFLDLDKCFENGQWSDPAVRTVQMFPGAAMEVSQSGIGLHIIGRCDQTVMADRRRKWRTADGLALECYVSKRFVAFGPHGWRGDPDTDHTAALSALVPKREASVDVALAATMEDVAPDEEIIRRLLASKSAGATFGDKLTPAQLWHADVDALARFFPSPGGRDAFDRSAADAALMALLSFWCNRNIVQMDRLYRQSGLMREKYERRADYRTRTLTFASGVSSVYDWSKAAGAAEAARGDGLMTAFEQQEYFEGCVYVRSLNRILTPKGELLDQPRFNAQYGGHRFLMGQAGTSPTKWAWEAFTLNQCVAFPKVAETMFRPNLPFGHIEGDAVNTYKPADVPCVPGDVSPFLDHLTRLLPAEGDRAVLLQWMAAVVQRPGVRTRWCPVIQGVEGNGKSFLVGCMVAAIGKRYCHLPKAEELAEKFNGYLEDNVFVAPEEIAMKGRIDLLNILKPYITNDSVEIRRMGVDKYMADNHTNWMMTTNYKDAVIKGRNDRRYAIFYTAQQEAEDLERDGMTGDYFDRLFGWAHGGGFAHVTHYLRSYDVGTLPGRAPRTTSTEEAIRESLGPIAQAILEAVEEERTGFRGGWVSSWAVTKLAEEHRIRSSGKSRGLALRDLGYEQVPWRAPMMVEEGGTRPWIWRQPHVTGGPDDYRRVQGYNVDPHLKLVSQSGGQPVG